ncbi:hypothetical protein [Enterobacillus tribolii]|uniref:Uncharacterized protein n=1 Tax=Enterobacillus tribolii TaxID=1487935 RepID=A0A370QUC1_9GAMM|nr:hypothetical protein [Enterobacillus tribolii]MBW7981089.1 hypothetical protein [Enterobacillus tribolii]RDK92854.1 hypothetical protein C8D90_103247 [Enterobacillus tribolii]
MSKRSEIIDGSKAAGSRSGLIYTKVLGWVDLGHAQGTDIRNILGQIERGERSGKERYDVTYSQSMSDPFRIMKMGKFITWRIKRGRSQYERKSIALGMMMSLARKFEGLQASFPVSLVTDSGFSGEDLVSDLLGFYRVVSIQNPFGILRPVSKEEALKIWDFYGKVGDWKNETFLPILFPDPEKFPNAKPRKGMLPNFMQTIRPWNDLRSGVVGVATANGSYIDDAKSGVLPYA